MASTYSPALRLELMATGDQSGTWGDTTNTNLGTLLEQAITGYLSVAQGDVANLTLTEVNGGTDQARNAVVEITGALTATRNVVVQTAEKLYTIKNSTTGGFSIVAKTTAGTGISIPPGASIDCYSDGTNVVAAANYWNGQIGGAVYLDAGATVGPVMDLFRDSTSPAASDVMGQVVFNGRDSAGNKQEYASIEAVILDATSTSEDGTLDFYATVAGTRTKLMSVAGSAVSPGSNDGAALGTTALMWSDLFLASGGVINWNNGDVTFAVTSSNFVATTNSVSGVPYTLTSDRNTAGTLANLQLRNSVRNSVNDALYLSFSLNDSGGAAQEYGRISGLIVSPTAAAEEGALLLGVVDGGVITSQVTVRSGILGPSTSNNTALGSTSLMWSDLFLASGGVINWNNGDVTLTHSAGTLTIATTDTGATSSPTLALYRNSASPASLDYIGDIEFQGEDSAGNTETYASIEARILDATSASEDGAVYFKVDVDGTLTTYLSFGIGADSAGAIGAVGLPLGKLSFPATQSASSDANTLDDYEETTWTPAMTFGGSATGVTYTTQLGVATTIGNLVAVGATILLTSNGTGTGTALVTSLPFTSSGGIGTAWIFDALSGFSGLTAGVSGGTSSGQTTINLRGPNTTGAATLTDTNVTNTASFRLSGVYFKA